MPLFTWGSPVGCPLKQLPKAFLYVKQIFKKAPEKNSGWQNQRLGKTHEVLGPDPANGFQSLEDTSPTWGDIKNTDVHSNSRNLNPWQEA